MGRARKPPIPRARTTGAAIAPVRSDRSIRRLDRLKRGKQIFLDFDETVCEIVPVHVLHKLEAAEEFRILHQIVGYGVTDPNTFLGALTDAERFLAETLEDYLTAGTEIPLWLCDTDVFFERFDTFRSRVP